MAAYMDGYGESGLSTEDLTTYKDYLDKYSANSTLYSYSNRILGDATREMGPFYYYDDTDSYRRVHSSWYGDNAQFFDVTYHHVYRECPYFCGIITSQFLFYSSMGGDAVDASSRLVLAPEK